MTSPTTTQTENGHQLTTTRLNRGALAGLVVSALSAGIGLFLLPTLRAAGWSFQLAFWALVGLEFLAAIGVAVSVLNLYEERPSSSSRSA